MKRLRAFIHKEFLHILRDTKTLVIVLLLPVLLIIIFGFGVRTEIKNAPIAILDKSNDELSNRLIDKLLSSGYFVDKGRIYSEDEVEDIFKKGQIKMVLSIPPNFSKTYYKEGIGQLQVIADASDMNTATALVAYTESILSDYNQEVLQEKQYAPIEVNLKMMYNEEMRDIYMFVPGILALILMIISALLTSVTLAKEKETGTLKVLLISPLHIWTIIIGKIIPYLIISILNTFIAVALSMWLLGMPLLGDVFALSLLFLIFLLTALSLGVFISSIVATQQLAIFVSVVGLFLPTALLSGFIYPVDNMPFILQMISNAIPATWFIEGVKAIMIKGEGFQAIGLQLGVLLLMMLFFVWLSAYNYTKKYK